MFVSLLVVGLDVCSLGWCLLFCFLVLNTSVLVIVYGCVCIDLLGVALLFLLPCCGLCG